MNSLIETGMTGHRLRGIFRSDQDYGRDGTLPRRTFVDILEYETKQIKLNYEERNSLTDAFVEGRKSDLVDTESFIEAFNSHKNMQVARDYIFDRLSQNLQRQRSNNNNLVSLFAQ